MPPARSARAASRSYLLFCAAGAGGKLFVACDYVCHNVMYALGGGIDGGGRAFCGLRSGGIVV